LKYIAKVSKCIVSGSKVGLEVRKMCYFLSTLQSSQQTGKEVFKVTHKKEKVYFVLKLRGKI